MKSWRQNPGMQLPYYVRRGHQINNGLENGFCKNYVKLYKNRMTKKLDEDQIT